MALDFGGAGSGSQVVIAPSSTLNSLAQSTRMLWIWFDNFVSNTGYCGKGAGATRKQMLNPTATTVFGAEARTTGGVYSTNANHSNFPTASVATGKWLCLCDSYDMAVAASGKMYCGDLSNLPAEATAYNVQTGTAAAVSDDSSANLLVGLDGDGDAVIDGKVALYAQWNRVLSLAEIQTQAQYSTPAGPGLQSGLRVFLWLEPTNLGGTGQQTDQSGNGNHGTPSATTFVASPSLPAYPTADTIWIRHRR